ncbi:hypothetical protein NCAS_0E00880 [Naumovozyma castellii]|uniref:SURF1-like protein n=1 Tax=Naumovozyma castellii TaxID=27288 RepID=G0VF93_NAUCA|nr:hypothetical protein NCAS_0E00880 [Naumovozyma castellii CBS 4309]CCC70158.1 hypothetical protein NCAS_0E00880 [Naumovozyma castellii CBS 4309]
MSLNKVGLTQFSIGTRQLLGRRFHPQIPLSAVLQAKRNVITSTFDWKPMKTTNNPNEEQDEGGSHRWHVGRKIALGLMFAMPIISFYLGTWQLRRLKWKTRLIATCETKLIYDPIPLPKDFQEDMATDWEYRKVILKGKFLHDEEMFVGPRAKNGQKGYLLFTPFVLADSGRKVMIERGWISEEKVAPESRMLHHLSLPQGDNVEVICMIRPPQHRGKFQWAKEDRNSRLWQVSDIYDMAKTSGCEAVDFQAVYDMSDHKLPTAESTKAATSNSPFSWKFWQSSYGATESQKQSSRNNLEKPETDSTVQFNEYQFIKAGVPIGKKPTIDLRNAHLQYLVTWYGLSFLSTIFLIVALKRYSKRSVISPEQLKRDKLKHAKKYM